jgi:hypothetical protein
MWVWECILLNWGITLILALLLGLSEALDEIPSVKANSIHRFVYNFLKVITRKKSKGD